MRFRAKWTLIHFGTPFVFFPLLLLLLLDTLDEREKAQKPPHVSLLSRGTLFFAVGHSGQLKNPFVLLLFFFVCLSARLSAFSVVSVSQFRYKKVDAHIVCTLGPPTTRIALTLYPQIISTCLGFHFHFTI